MIQNRYKYDESEKYWRLTAIIIGGGLILVFLTILISLTIIITGMIIN